MNPLQATIFGVLAEAGKKFADRSASLRNCAARQVDLGRQVVVKVMHDHVANDPNFRKRFERKPELIIEDAVSRMLPKTKLGKQMFTKLKVYRGDKHPHEAQKPEARVLA